jgi:hypothetical protein
MFDQAQRYLGQKVTSADIAFLIDMTFLAEKPDL